MTVQEVIDNLSKCSVQELTAQGSPELEGLWRQTLEIFDRFQGADQTIVSALLLGSLWATLDGAASEFEQMHNLILTMEDRLQMFCAMVRIVYASSMAEVAQQKLHTHQDKSIM